MLLLVGLGNPGKEYEGSLHNLGFQVLERVARQVGAAAWKKQHDALIAQGSHQGRRYLLAKPQTYMNESGRAVQALLHYYRIDLADSLVVVDDLDLPPGRVRQRDKGSDGGHRGLRSIIECVGSRDFKRIRIGVGRPVEKGRVVSYLIGANGVGEALEDAVQEATRLALTFLETGCFENWSSS